VFASHGGAVCAGSCVAPVDAAPRPMLIDALLPKLEEWVEHSRGRIRADVVHDKLAALAMWGRNAPPAARWRR